ncbi:MAG TPA: alpha/beta hydrolase [Acidimicrobiales bacterium]|jgi:acetyl esterase
MALEPRVAWIIRAFNAFDRGPGDLPMVTRRAQSARLARLRGLVMHPGPSGVAVADQLVPVQGGKITVRLYRPAKPGTLPLYVFLHGGGWCIGTLDERDPRCRTIAHEAGCLVASVDYRLAPENTYPTAPEDCYAALQWLVTHADELECDPGRVAIGGESAGANLAAVVCLMARDRSGPALRYQWLDVPATDLTLSQPSVHSTPPGYLLDFTQMTAYRDHYLPEPERQALEPYASPLRADDLTGLPPATVLTCGHDPLRDDGSAYAARLTEAGVAVHHVHLDGHVHPSFAYTRLVPSARSYEHQAVDWLAAAWG